METILEANGVYKTFHPPLSFGALLGLSAKPEPVCALRDVSFRVKKGRIIGILGPNGAGKTTLLKILSSLILPDKGKVVIAGIPMDDDCAQIKARVGLVVSQERSFYWRLTGRQNFEFFAALYGLDKARIKSQSERLFKLFGVDYADRRFDAYSAGMKQTFAVLRSLVHDPEILLLDEPFQSLDHGRKHQLKTVIRETLVGQEEKTVLLATQQIEETAAFCDEFIILKQGRVRAQGAIGELRALVGDPTADMGKIFMRLAS